MKFTNYLCFLFFIGFVGCSPDVAILEEKFSEKVESAFRERDLEQALALYEFKDEPDKFIEELGERWEQEFDRELGSIVFEEIPEMIQTRLDLGFEYDGAWYKPDPEPYKLIRIIYKKKERKNDDPTTWGVSSSTPVAIKGKSLVFPGLKLMDRPPKPIKLILPNDFVGKFSVVWLESGADAVETEEFLIYEFPIGGELAVATLDYFIQGRAKIIEFQDGRSILPSDTGEVDSGGFYFDPNSMSMMAGSIGAPAGTSASTYHGTKLSWKIMKRTEKLSD